MAKAPTRPWRRGPRRAEERRASLPQRVSWPCGLWAPLSRSHRPSARPGAVGRNEAPRHATPASRRQQARGPSIAAGRGGPPPPAAPGACWGIDRACSRLIKLGLIKTGGSSLDSVIDLIFCGNKRQTPLLRELPDSGQWRQTRKSLWECGQVCLPRPPWAAAPRRRPSPTGSHPSCGRPERERWAEPGFWKPRGTDSRGGSGLCRCPQLCWGTGTGVSLSGPRRPDRRSEGWASGWGGVSGGA